MPEAATLPTHQGKNTFDPPPALRPHLASLCESQVMAQSWWDEFVCLGYVEHTWTRLSSPGVPVPPERGIVLGSGLFSMFPIEPLQTTTTTRRGVEQSFMRFCLDRELSLGNKNGPGPDVPDTQPWDSGEHEHDMFTRGRRSFDSSVTSTCDACLHSPNGMGTHLEQRTAQHLLRRPPTNRKIRQQTEFGFVKFCIDKVQGQAWSGGGFRIQFGGGRRPVKHEQIHSLEPYVQERGTDILSRSHRGVTLGLAAGELCE